MVLRIRRHKPGDLVQLSFDDGSHTLRGTVVAAEKTANGMSIRLLSIPGYDGLLARVPARRLSPADPFQPVPVDSLNLTATTPAEAQRFLVALVLAVRNAELLYEPPDEVLLRDQTHLAEALGNWSGSGSDQVLACAEASAQETIEDGRTLTAAQLAAQSFPTAGDPTVPSQATQPNRISRANISSQPRARRP